MDVVNEVYVGEIPQDEDESDLDDDHVYMGKQDMQEVFDEDQILEASATYQDVRHSLREQRNSRGYYISPARGKSSSSSTLGGKGKGKGSGGGKSRPTLAMKGRDRVTKGPQCMWIC